MTANFLVEVVKNLFGISKSNASESEGGVESETNITVERDPDDAESATPPDTDIEQEEPDDVGEELEDDGEAEEEAEDEEAEEEAEDEEVEEAEEEAEVEEAEEEAEVEEAEEEVEAEESAAPGSEDSVGEVSGIGPTYSDRLNDVDIETVADLAAAEASAVAEAAQVSESRAEDWIQQAKDW